MKRLRFLPLEERIVLDGAIASVVSHPTDHATASAANEHGDQQFHADKIQQSQDTTKLVRDHQKDVKEQSFGQLLNLSFLKSNDQSEKSKTESGSGNDKTQKDSLLNNSLDSKEAFYHDLTAHLKSSASFDFSSLYNSSEMTAGFREHSVSLLNHANHAEMNSSGTLLGEHTIPAISINNVDVVEQGTGSQDVVFTVSLSHASTEIVTVKYHTADGTATTAAQDYQYTSGSLTFLPGQTSKTVDVSINGNTPFKPNETFYVDLTDAAHAIVKDSQGVGTIQSSDQISISNATDTASVAGPTSETFTVTLAHESTIPITVNYTTVDGTAKAGIDYTSVSGTITFAPGQKIATISVPINQELVFKPDQSFFVNLSDVNNPNVTLASHQATGTIHDNLNVLLIDSNVAGAAQLEQAALKTDLVIMYDGSNSTLASLSAQIQTALGGLKASSIAIASDGTSAEFAILQNTIINSASLQSISANASILGFLHSLAANLLPDGQLNLLGCNIAAGQDGQDFVALLQNVMNDQGSHISVNASVDFTGSSAQNANWVLEDGNVDAGHLYFDMSVLAAWNNVLGNANGTGGFTTPRFTTNANGNITLIGNTSMVSPNYYTIVNGQKVNAGALAPTATLSNTQGLTAANTENNVYDMQYVNIDSSGAPAGITIYNSSSATLGLPAGETAGQSSILFAGLYWAGDVSPGTKPGPDANGTVQATPHAGYNANGTAVGATQLSNGQWVDTTAESQVLVKLPGQSNYTVLYANPSDLYAFNNSSNPGSYGNFYNLTSAVQALGANAFGTYTVANVAAGTGQNHYAGWSLVVVYGNPTEAFRNLTVFDGYQNVTGTNSVSVNVSGFTLPSTGTVHTQVGVVSYEGDLGITGDSFSIQGNTEASPTLLSDVGRSTSNFFTSSITQDNSFEQTKSPNFSNNQGIDIARISLSNVLSNHDTSAKLTFKTSGDTYFPQVATFATDLYPLQFQVTKTATDVTPGHNNLFLAGDEILYTITVKNTGTDGSIQTILTDTLPANETYVANSLNILSSPSGAPSGHMTDLGGDDYAAMSGGTLIFNLGSGPQFASIGESQSNGGALAPGQTETLTFHATILATLPDQSSLINTASVSGYGQTLGVSGGLVTGTGTNSIVISNANPSAQDVTYSINENSSLVINNGSQDLSILGNVTAGPNRVGDIVQIQPESINATTTTAGYGSVSVSVDANGAFNFTPPTGFFGTYTFLYQAIDVTTGKLSNPATVTINVAPVPPTPVSDVYHTNENQALTISAPGILGNDSPINSGDVLQVDTSSVTNPLHGALTKNADGSFTYTPNAGFVGTDSFTYKAQDTTNSTKSTETATVIISVAPVAPTPASDVYSTSENQALTISAPGILSNDTPVNSGDVLQVDTGSVTSPAHGTLTQNADGSFTYTPNAGFVGTDSFTYKVQDTTNSTESAGTATVTISVVSVAPTPASDVYSTNENQALTISAPGILSNDTPVNPGDVLQVDTGSVTSPAHGTLTKNANGSFTYTPNAGFFGSDSFTYKVQDTTNHTESAGTATVTINVIPVAPTPASDIYSTNENQTLAVLPSGILGNDHPANSGDVLQVDVSTVSNPTHGTLTQNANGSFTYTPNAGFFGSDSFTYKVQDTTNNTESAGTATVTIRVSPVAPTAGPSTHTTLENTPTTILPRTILARASTPIAGDTLALLPPSVTQPSHGTLSFNPDGSLNYTPNPGFFGTDTFTHQVLDVTNGTISTNEGIITITVLPVAPTPAADAYSTNENQALAIPASSILSNDVSGNPGDSLQVDLSSLSDPSHGTLTKNPDGSFTYTPNTGFFGTDSFTYKVQDTTNGTESAGTATVTINVVPVAPTPAADVYSTNENQAITVSAPGILSNDMSGNTGDSLQVDLSSVSDPSHGTLTKNPDGSFTYTPNTGFFGTDSFTYKVQDTTNSTESAGTATVTINIVPVAPTSVPDVYTVKQDQTLTVSAPGVLNNDISGIAGDKLQVDLSALTQPSHGRLIENENGSFTYIPSPGFFGTDSFTYQVQDVINHTESNAAVVTITVSEVPAAPNQSNQETPEIPTLPPTHLGLVNTPFINTLLFEKNSSSHQNPFDTFTEAIKAIRNTDYSTRFIGYADEQAMQPHYSTEGAGHVFNFLEPARLIKQYHLAAIGQTERNVAVAAETSHNKIDINQNGITYIGTIENTHQTSLYIVDSDVVNLMVPASLLQGQDKATPPATVATGHLLSNQDKITEHHFNKTSLKSGISQKEPSNAHTSKPPKAA